MTPSPPDNTIRHLTELIESTRDHVEVMRSMWHKKSESYGERIRVLEKMIDGLSVQIGDALLSSPDVDHLDNLDRRLAKLEESATCSCRRVEPLT